MLLPPILYIATPETGGWAMHTGVFRYAPAPVSGVANPPGPITIFWSGPASRNKPILGADGCPCYPPRE